MTFSPPHQLSDVAAGLDYLHSHDVIHGDLRGVRDAAKRLPNLLIRISGKRPRRRCGPCAPNRLRSCCSHSRLWFHCAHDQQPCCPVGCARDTEHGTASHQSIGCLFVCYGNLRGRIGNPIRTEHTAHSHRHQVFTGTVPFHDMTPAAAAVGVLLGNRPKRPLCPSLTDDLWGLMEHCWSQEPRHRPEISRVIPRLRATSLRRGHVGAKENQAAADETTLLNFPRRKGFWFSGYTACHTTRRSSPGKQGMYRPCPG